MGTALSIPVARYASRRRAREDGAKTHRSGAHTLVHGFGLLYTIPSIAFFVLMPLILGTSIISPVNVLVALTIYTMALMVRSGVDAFNAVPEHVVESSRALGYTPARAFFTVDYHSLYPCFLPVSAWRRWQILRWYPWVRLLVFLSLGTLFTDGLGA